MPSVWVSLLRTRSKIGSRLTCCRPAGNNMSLLQPCGWEKQKLTKSVKMTASSAARLSLPRVRITSDREQFIGSTSVEEFSFEMLFVGIGDEGLIPLSLVRRCGEECQMLVLLAERSTALLMYKIRMDIGGEERE